MLAPLAISSVPAPAVKATEPLAAEMLPPTVNAELEAATAKPPPALPVTVPLMLPWVTLALAEFAVNCRLAADRLPPPVTCTPVLLLNVMAPLADMLPAFTTCGLLTTREALCKPDAELTLMLPGAKSVAAPVTVSCAAAPPALPIYKVPEGAVIDVPAVLDSEPLPVTVSEPLLLVIASVPLVALTSVALSTRLPVVSVSDFALRLLLNVSVPLSGVDRLSTEPLLLVLRAPTVRLPDVAVRLMHVLQLVLPDMAATVPVKEPWVTEM